MKRKCLAFVMAIIMTFMLIPASMAHATSINVTIDGEAVVFPGGQGPVIVDDRTLVPVRGVFEALGFDVDWLPETGTAVLENDEFLVKITVGGNTFTVNDVSHNLDVPAQIINDRTMLPIRLVLENVGYIVDWDGATNTVLINSAVLHEFMAEPIYRPLNPSLVPREPATGDVNQAFLADALGLIEHVESTNPIFEPRWRHLLDPDYERVRAEFIEHASRAPTPFAFRLELLRFTRALRSSYASYTNVSLLGNVALAPFFTVIDNSLYTVNSADEIDSRVLSIGGVCVQEIFDVIDTYVFMVSEPTRNYNYALLSRKRDLLDRAGAAIHNNTVEIAAVRPNGRIATATVPFTTGGNVRNVPSFNHNTRYEIIDDVFFICYRRFTPGHTELVAMAEALNAAIDDGIRNIIFDIRYNPGGMGPFSILNLLLQNQGYSPPPTNRHNITIAVLMNNHSHSSSVNFAAIAQDSGAAVLIGEPSVCAPSFFGTVRHAPMPNTNVRIGTSQARIARWDQNANQDMFEMDILVPSAQALYAALEFFGVGTYPSVAMQPFPRVTSPFEPPPPPILHASLNPDTAGIMGTNFITIDTQTGARIRNILGTDFDVFCETY